MLKDAAEPRTLPCLATVDATQPDGISLTVCRSSLQWDQPSIEGETGCAFDSSRLVFFVSRPGFVSSLVGALKVFGQVHLSLDYIRDHEHSRACELLA